MQIGGKYKLLNQLQDGPICSVFHAEDLEGNRLFIRALKPEALTGTDISELRHLIQKIWKTPPLGILTHLDLIEHEGTHYIVQEFFEGSILSQLTTFLQVSIEDFLYYASLLARTIGSLHQQRGILYCLCPSHIYLNTTKREMKVTGFCPKSIAEILLQQIQDPVVQRSYVPYLAPEQMGRMNRGVDYRADLYSLGIVYYELLIGAPPFLSEDPLETIHGHIARNPLSLRQLRNDIPEQLEAIVQKLLSKNAGDRYQNGFGLLYDLEECKRRFAVNKKISDFPVGQQDISAKLKLPEKIIGRRKEQDILQSTFDDICMGQSAVVFVEGPSGIGKSWLIGSVNTTVLKQRGYLLQSKYDQLTKHTPLNALISILRQLAQYILSEPEQQLLVRRERLEQAVGESTRLLADLIPEYKAVVGEQPELPQLGPVEVQNRFEFVLLEFIRVLATKEHPLVVVLDDVQWIEHTSLNLIRSLILDESIKYALWILAYREEDLGQDNPLQALRKESYQRQIPVHTLTLAPFGPEETTEFVSETLHTSQERAQSLAQILQSKTGGNPFFIGRCIKSIQEKGLIIFDSKTGWQWDTDQITKTEIPDNVVDLVVAGILALPAPIKLALQMASCIGNSFKITTLASLLNMPVEGVLEVVSAAIDFGLIEQQPDRVRFSHDRIQEAAYNSLPEGERRKNHYKIGVLRHASTGQDEIESHVIAIVNQFNLALDQIQENQERREVAGLNLLAGKRAITTGAYANALSYFENGLALLGDRNWIDEYDLTYTLFDSATEAAYLARDFDKMQLYGEAVLAGAHSALEKTKTYDFFIQTAQQQLETRKAVDIALRALSEFGIRLTPHTGLFSVIVKYLKVNHKLGKMTGADLKNLPRMDDRQKQAALKIMVRAGIPAYIFSPRLFMMLSLARLDITLDHGLTNESPQVLAGYASFQCAFRGNVEIAQKIGKISMEIARTIGDPESDAYSKFVYYTFLDHWTERLDHNLYEIGNMVHYCAQIGAYNIAGPFATLWGLNAFVSGMNLSQAEKTGNELARIVSKFRLRTQILAMNTIRQSFHNLLHDDTSTIDFPGEQLSSERMVEIFAQNDVKLGVFIVWSLKTILSVFWGNFDEARFCAEKAAECKSAAFGMSLKNVFEFYNLLICIRLASSATGARKRKLLREIRTNLLLLAKAKKYSPTNWNHKEALIQAELFRLVGKEDKAISQYETAISLANKNRFIHEAGLFNELAGEAFLQKGCKTTAKHYFEEARQCYQNWSAFAKVKQLETKHQKYLSSAAKSLSKEQSWHADYARVAQALQAISKEIRIEKLFENVVRALIESCDATKAEFFSMRENGLYLEATQSIELHSKVQIVSQKMSPDSDIFHLILDRVVKSSTPLVVDNAEIDPAIHFVDYVKKHNVKSILCLPVKRKAQVTGVLYLENNHQPGAFGSDTVDILTLLASQVGISLENAKLYDDVIQSAKKNRTLSDSLSISNQEFRRTLSALLASKERLSLVIQGAGVGLWELNLMTRRVQFNEQLAKLHGVDGYLKEIDAEELKSVVHPADLKNFETALEQYEPDNNPYFEMEYRVGSEESGWRWLFLRGHLTAREVDGTPIRAMGVLLDIDPIRRAEEQKAELEKEILQQQKIESIGQLTGGIAHDLNNLITPILGYADLLKEELKGRGTIAEDVDEIRYAGKRARDLIGQLLAFGRKQVLELSILDLNDVIVDFERILSGVTHDNIQLHVALNATPSSIRGDLSQLQQVLLNLVVNARDAMPEGGEITIQTKTQYVDGSHPAEIADLPYGPYVHLTIRDTGVGMDEETRKKVFEPFFTTKEVGQGTGLGLSTVYGIMKQHSGNIYVKSNPGKGTQFDLYFPLEQKSKNFNPAITSQAPAATKGDETVLVVEDEKSVRKLVTAILKKRGYNVIAAVDGQDALEVASEYKGVIDLLLTDIVMPKIKGPEVYERLHKHRPEMRVLYMTGYAHESFIGEEAVHDTVKLLAKPFTPDILNKTVRDVLDEVTENS